MALALSPIYLWQSGLPQVHHILAAIAIGIYLLAQRRIQWRPWWTLGIGFALYTVTVNFVIFALYNDLVTLLSSIYYIFDFLVFVLLINVSQKLGKLLLSKVFWIHVALLAITAALSMVGVGRYYGEGRIMGFFNDPNQIGNWVLWATIIVGTTGRAVYRSWLPGMLVTGVGTLAIIFTASRSATLGLLTLLAVYALIGLYYILSVPLLKARIRSVRVIVLPMVIIAMMIGFTTGFANSQLERLLSQRQLLMARFQERDPDDTWEGRGYDRIWKFPEYLFLGAGEGAYQRYSERTWFLGEIHSNWAGILFNYGLVGSLLFFGFIYHLLRRIKLFWFKCMLLAPFVYGFFTYSLRNWYFWIGLAVVYASWEYIRIQKLYHSSKPIGC